MFESLNVEEKAERCYLESPITGDYLQDSDGNFAYVDVMSTESSKGREINHKVQNRLLKQHQKKQNQLSAEQIESSTVETLAALTTGWYLVDPRNGNPVEDEFSEENAYQLYKTVPWIRNQVEEFAGDSANYFRGAN